MAAHGARSSCCRALSWHISLGTDAAPLPQRLLERGVEASTVVKVRFLEPLCRHQPLAERRDRQLDREPFQTGAPAGTVFSATLGRGGGHRHKP